MGCSSWRMRRRRTVPRRVSEPVGTLSQAATYSFYPGKNLGAYGDAGAVTTDDPALEHRIRLISDHGASGGTSTPWSGTATGWTGSRPRSSR